MVIMYQWITEGANSCAQCAENNGKIFETPPKKHYNCKCSIIETAVNEAELKVAENLNAVASISNISQEKKDTQNILAKLKVAETKAELKAHKVIAKEYPKALKESDIKLELKEIILHNDGIIDLKSKYSALLKNSESLVDGFIKALSKLSLIVTVKMENNFLKMVHVNTIGADKLYHALANAKAAQLGQQATIIARQISLIREDYFGDSASVDSLEDHLANIIGRKVGKENPNASEQQLVDILEIQYGISSKGYLARNLTLFEAVKAGKKIFK